MNTRTGFLILAKGFCMGAADVIPGVSGGTMAFILGIYTRLIDALRSFDAAWLRAVVRLDWKTLYARSDLGFLVLLGAGIASALLFFTRVVPVPQLLQTHPEPIYGLFFGLIAGSILVLLADAGRLRALDVLMLAAGAAAGFLVFTLVPHETPSGSLFIFLCGALAICAMLLPGISGSFVLLMLKKYTLVMTAIGYFDFHVLIPFALGAVTGLVLFSRLLSFLLHHYYRPAVLTIIGILVASLWVLWPFQERQFDSAGGIPQQTAAGPVLPGQFSATVALALLMLVVGLMLIFAIHRLARSSQAAS